MDRLSRVVVELGQCVKVRLTKPLLGMTDSVPDGREQEPLVAVRSRHFPISIASTLISS